MNLAHALGHRPRVEGDREREILETTLAILAEVGYDRLTMDAVATKAKASKATLYRRWSSKANLVIDALRASKGPHEAPPDTGSLRGDLQEAFCGMGGLNDPDAIAIFSSVITAMGRDPEFAAAFREQFITEKVAISRTLWERARDRGELREGLDLDLIEPALAGIVLQRIFLHGENPSQDFITRVIDQIILPAALRPELVPVSTTTSTTKE